MHRNFSVPLHTSAKRYMEISMDLYAPYNMERNMEISLNLNADNMERNTKMFMYLTSIQNRGSTYPVDHDGSSGCINGVTS